MLLIHGMRLEIDVDAFRVGSFFTFYFSVFFRLDIIKLKCIVCVCVCARRLIASSVYSSKNRRASKKVPPDATCVCVCASISDHLHHV